MTSFNASLDCRIDWRPSRLLQFILLMLGVLAALSLWLSALPWWLSLGLALLSMHAAVRAVRKEATRERCSLVWQAGADDLILDFDGRVESWSSPKLVFRGPLASLCGIDADGRGCHLQWWPDTLDSRGLRSLRLAASMHARVRKPLRFHGSH